MPKFLRRGTSQPLTVLVAGLFTGFSRSRSLSFSPALPCMLARAKPLLRGYIIHSRVIRLTREYASNDPWSPVLRGAEWSSSRCAKLVRCSIGTEVYGASWEQEDGFTEGYLTVTAHACPFPRYTLRYPLNGSLSH